MEEKLTVGSIMQLTAQTGPGLIGVPLGGEGAMWMAGEPAREIARLKDELEALRKDAERYRWLRDNPWPPILEADITLHRNARWDAEIDAAMASSAAVGAA